MPRPKEFDREVALASAIELFRAHGYEGTSTVALLRCMRISRQSMYDTFGDKRSLYLAALRQYNADSIADQLRALNAAKSGLDGIEAMLLGMANKTGKDRDLCCLGVSATCEFGRTDRDVSTIIDTSDRTLVSAIEARVAEAKTAGEIAKGVSARAVAEFVVATLAGMKVAARGGASVETLRNIAHIAARSWR